MQIDNIERVSVEQYYEEMLLQYSDQFGLDTKLSSEMLVRQDFVDFIYSDHFIGEFTAAYEVVISVRNELVASLDHVSEIMRQPRRDIDLSKDDKVVQQMTYFVDSMAGLIQENETGNQKANKTLTELLDRKQYLEAKLIEAETIAAGTIQECLSRVYTKIGEFVTHKKTEIIELENIRNAYIEEKKNIQGSIVMPNRHARLKELDKEIKKAEKHLTDAQAEFEENSSLMSLSQDGKTDEEILEWMGKLTLQIREIKDEVNLYNTRRKEMETIKTELSNTLPARIQEAEQAIKKISSESYPEDAAVQIKNLREKLKEFSLLGTYQMIFDMAVSQFRQENDVKAITGKYHKYDLYVRLLFAMRYFRESRGSVRYLCIDEGQDLAINEYRLLYELNQRNLVFNVYGDTNQLMKTGRGISDWSVLQQVFEAREYTLNENYRNTNQITRFCNQKFEMNVLQTGVDGASVREIARKKLEEELALLKITTERIAILLPRGAQKKRYLDMEQLPDNIREIVGEKMDNGCIAVMYVDEVKGIEFEKVYVIDNKMSRNEKYIAYTRALSELIIVVDDNVADYDKDSDNVKKSSKKKSNKHAGAGTLKYSNSNRS